MTKEYRSLPQPQRAAIFARVSTEKDTQELSIENQDLLLEEYCVKNGFTIVKRYVETGSGAKLFREVIMQIKEDIMNHEYDILVIKDLSRLARNMQITQEVINLAQLYGVKINTPNATMNAQLESNLSTAFVGFLSMSYQMESQNTSERIKSTIHLNQRSGKIHSSIPAYGYEIVNQNYQIKKDETVDIVKRIFSMYAYGQGIDAIAKQLNDEEVLTPSSVLKKRNAGLLWGGSTIKGILRNRIIYIGELTQGKTETQSIMNSTRLKKSLEEQDVIKNHHEPIIDLELFNSVQELLSSKTQLRPKMQKHLFTNLVFCEGCGRSLWYRHSKSGGRYKCGGRSKYGKKGCLAPVGITEKDLLRILQKDMQDFIDQIDNNEYWRLLQKNIEGKQESSEKKISELQAKIKGHEKRIERRVWITTMVSWMKNYIVGCLMKRSSRLLS